MKAIARRTFVNAVVRPAIAFAPWPFSIVRTLAQNAASERLIVHSARPEDLETPVHLLTTFITRNELFYVRSHFYTPAIHEQEWRLVIDGEVERPQHLTLDDIKR